MNIHKNQTIVFASFLLIFSILGQIWLPWWILMLVSALAGFLFMRSPIRAFGLAFIIICLEWFLYAYFIHHSNDFILADKIATLFKLDNSLLLLLIAALLAGFAAASAAVSGTLLRNLFRKK